MSLWSSEYLARIAVEAEIEIAKELQCITDRLSIPVYMGRSQYQLPSYVNNIRKVLWKGFRLDPVGYIDYENWIQSLGSQVGGAFDGVVFDSGVFDTGSVSTGTPQAKPLRYFYSNYGENVITFNPGVHEDIISYNDGLYTENISNSVIIEFYRMPDGDKFTIPEYIRRRTIKSYVLWKSFLKEGAGQNLKAAQYHQQRYLITLQRARNIINNIYSAAIKNRPPNQWNDTARTIARPVLPPNYGIVVGDDWCNDEY